MWSQTTCISEKAYYHSCETQFITVINDWAKVLDTGGQVDAIILDFEKALDTHLHEKLINYS